MKKASPIGIRRLAHSSSESWKPSSQRSLLPVGR